MSCTEQDLQLLGQLNALCAVDDYGLGVDEFKERYPHLFSPRFRYPPSLIKMEMAPAIFSIYQALEDRKQNSNEGSYFLMEIAMNTNDHELFDRIFDSIDLGFPNIRFNYLEMALMKSHLYALEKLFATGYRLESSRVERSCVAGAVRIGSEESAISAINLLLANGVNIGNAHNPQLGDVTPLIEAIEMRSTEVVRFFLQRGVNPNLPNSKGKFPLDIARKYGGREIIELLIQARSGTPSAL